MEHHGIVSAYNADEGWGVIDADDFPGGCWVHFSVIDMIGYKVLHVGQRVIFTVGKGTIEDYNFVADHVRRA